MTEVNEDGGIARVVQSLAIDFAGGKLVLKMSDGGTVPYKFEMPRKARRASEETTVTTKTEPAAEGDSAAEIFSLLMDTGDQNEDHEGEGGVEEDEREEEVSSTLRPILNKARMHPEARSTLTARSKPLRLSPVKREYSVLNVDNPRYRVVDHHYDPLDDIDEELSLLEKARKKLRAIERGRGGMDRSRSPVKKAPKGYASRLDPMDDDGYRDYTGLLDWTMEPRRSIGSKFMKRRFESENRDTSNDCDWPGCGRKFDAPCRLKQHYLTHSDQRDFPCTECNKAFRSHAHLVAHERTHTGEKPFDCPRCGKKFAQVSGVNRHLQAKTLCEMKQD